MNEQADRTAERLEQLIDRCLNGGASDADASIGRGQGISVEVRDGALENLERTESEGVSLRCLVGHRQANVSGSDLSDDGLKALAERCVAMAKAAPEDPYCGVAPAEHLVTDMPVLDLSGEPEPDPEALEKEALEAEAAALAVQGVDHVSSCGNGWQKAERWVRSSNGFASYRASGSTGLGLAAVARQGEAMERDYESRTVRRLEDRPAPKEIGRIAGERAVARLGPRPVKTQKGVVVFDRRVAESLLGPLLSAMSGPSIARGVSFLKDHLGKQIFPKGTMIWDDPFRVRGMGSRAHDGEGRAVAKRALIENGILGEWLLNGPSAKQLGLEPNGYASGGFGRPPGVGTSNVHLEAGTKSVETLLSDVGTGLIVKDMFGPSINPNTGDYSVGVAGFWFEQGEIVHPVSEVTIAGTLIDMYSNLQVASDLELRGTRDAPSILIEGLSIAGD